MTRPGRILAAAALACLAAGGAAIAARPAARPSAQRDWARVVVATPEGGFRMGNPNAAVKLIEYGSLTCPHCAHFESEGVPALVQNYVRTGKLSYEFRNFVRDPYDLTAALLSRCAGPRGYFPMTHEIFATQDQWTGRFAKLSASDYDALEAMAPTLKVVRIASIAGLDAMAARYGVPAPRAKACLSDAAGVKRLTDMRQVAVTKFELQGTPTFVINGRKADGAAAWATLEPLLKAQGG